MKIYFATFGEGRVYGIQSGNHRLVGRHMKIREGKAPVTDLTSIVPGFFTQYGKIRRALVLVGQVNEGVESGVEKSGETLTGLGLIVAKAGIFPGQELAREHPVGLGDGFVTHGFSLSLFRAVIFIDVSRMKPAGWCNPDPFPAPIISGIPLRLF
ncbi:MAG: hypothetical protein D4R46_01770, partial [Chloroflexi bacterium]